jgi:hypothetical protein
MISLGKRIPLLINEQKPLLERFVADLHQDVPNLEATVEHVSIEAIEVAGIVQSSFAEFNSLMSSAQPDIFHRHSAFLYVPNRRNLFLAPGRCAKQFAVYYGAAGSLLRIACEAILRRAFWECLAHKRYRGHAEIVGEKAKAENRGARRNILDWLKERFNALLRLEARRNRFPLWDRPSVRRFCSRRKRNSTDSRVSSIASPRSKLLPC